MTRRWGGFDLRREWREGRIDLRREWLAGRIDLHDLPIRARRLAWLMLWLIAASCVALVIRSLGLPMPGWNVDIPAQFLARSEVTSIPGIVVIISCAGLAVASAALAVALQRPGPQLARAGLAAIALLGLALSSQQIGAARDLRRLEDSLRPRLEVPVPSASSVIEIAGWLGVFGAIAAVALAVRVRAGSRPWSLAVAAAAPFVLIAATFAIVGYETFELGPEAAARGLPPSLNAKSYVAPAIVVVGSIVGDFWLVPLGLWQVVTWARASRREIGLRVAARDARWPWLLAALLTLKLGWLALGYTGRLPLALGGGSPVWESSRADGVPAWLIALLFAGLAGWWLASSRRLSVSERGFIPAAILVTVGFSLVTVAMSLLLAAFPVAGLLPVTNLADSTLEAACRTSWGSEAIGNAVRCLIVRTTDRQLELTIISQLMTWAVALGLAAWLWRRRRHRSTALFLFATVAWVAPRVPDVLRALLGQAPGQSVAPELATFDTTLTIVAAVLASLWYLGRQRVAGPGALLLILTVSTLLVHAGTLVPERSGSVLFFVALVFPVAYELLLDSEELNRPHPARPERVLQALGLRLGVLSVVTLSVVLGVIESRDTSYTQLGKVLFAVPFTALLVAATLSRSTRAPITPDPVTAPAAAAIAPSLAATRDRRPVPVRTLGAGVAGAALFLGILVAAAGLADMTLAGIMGPGPRALPASRPTPMPGEGYRNFHLHVAATHEEAFALLDQVSRHVQESGTVHAAADAGTIATLVQEEELWLREHPPAECFALAASRWQTAIGQLGLFGRLLGGLAQTSSQTDVDTGTNALAQFLERDDEFLTAHEAAKDVCLGIRS